MPLYLYEKRLTGKPSVIMDFEASSRGTCDTIAAISRPTFADFVRLWQEGMERGIRDLKPTLHAQRPPGMVPIVVWKNWKKLSVVRTGARCAAVVTAKVDVEMPGLLAPLQKLLDPPLASTSRGGNLALRFALAAKLNRPVNLKLVCWWIHYSFSSRWLAGRNRPLRNPW